MDPDAVELPIFELPLVLLPGELLPLHIFEERYKRMIGRCLDESEPFGIVFHDTEGGARRVGCEARVTEVTERFEDGRLNIVVTGERPFRVLDRFEASEYPAGEVAPVASDPLHARPLESEPPGADEAGAEQASPSARAREAFAELLRRVGGGDPDPDELAALDSYALAARVELPPETKQRLLELRSERERMRVLAEALGALVTAVARSREIAERARLNGKVIVG
jgi:Lon protease-like protein